MHFYILTWFCIFQAAPSIECSSSALGENFEDSIANFDEQFSVALICLLNKINELATEDNSEKMLNVLYRYVLLSNSIKKVFFHEKV